MAKTKIEKRKTKNADPYVIDDTAYRYLSALEHAEVLKKALLAMCRQCGFTPTDAPKTKMLAGEFYEVLASRATRTVVDQGRAGSLRSKMLGEFRGRRAFAALLCARTVFDVADGAERAIEGMSPWVQRHFHATVRPRAAGTRLTVRKKRALGASASGGKKSQSSRVPKSQRRKAA